MESTQRSRPDDPSTRLLRAEALSQGGKRTLRRFELVALAAVVSLMIISGLAWTAGLTDRVVEEVGESSEAPIEDRTFRPLVADFNGTVEVKSVGSVKWRPLKWSDAFVEGDRIRTGPGSTCDLLLTWGTGVRLTPGTELTWQQLGRQGETYAIEIGLRRGQILASLDRLPEGSSFEVITRHSHARVRGTVLSVSASNKKTKISVLTGVVEVVDRSDPTRRVRATAGMGVDLTTGSRMTRPTPLSAEERAKLLGETTKVEKRVERLSPQAVVEVPDEEEDEDRPTESEDTKTEDSRPSPQPSPTTTKKNARQISADRARIEGMVRGGLQLVNQGNIPEALSYCTSGFRTLIWGPRAERTGVARELSRQQGDQRLVLEADRVRSVLLLEFEVLRLNVQLKGDVAYLSALVATTVHKRSNTTSRGLRQVYSCSGRCLRVQGRWLLDVVTATEVRR